MSSACLGAPVPHICLSASMCVWAPETAWAPSRSGLRVGMSACTLRVCTASTPAPAWAHRVHGRTRLTSRSSLGHERYCMCRITAADVSVPQRRITLSGAERAHERTTRVQPGSGKKGLCEETRAMLPIRSNIRPAARATLTRAAQPNGSNQPPRLVTNRAP